MEVVDQIQEQVVGKIQGEKVVGQTQDEIVDQNQEVVRQIQKEIVDQNYEVFGQI